MKRPARRPQPADFKMALGGGLKYKQQHICEECGSNSSPKTKRRHLTIEHQAQLLVHNCRDCGKRYQTRNSLARHVDKKYMSSKGMTRPALETTIEQESLLLVKKLDTPPETENTTKHVSHSPVYTNNGISNGMNLDPSTLKCDSQPQAQSVERPSTTSDKVAVATLTQRPTLSLQDYPSSSSSVSRTHFHPSESNGSTDNATDTPAGRCQFTHRILRC